MLLPRKRNSRFLRNPMRERKKGRWGVREGRWGVREKGVGREKTIPALIACGQTFY